MSISKAKPEFTPSHASLMMMAKIFVATALVALVGLAGYLFYLNSQSVKTLQETVARENALRVELSDLHQQLDSTTAALTELQNSDQLKRNEALTKEITDLQTGFKEATNTYEELLKLSDQSGKKSTLSAQLTQAFLLLSQRNYSTASAKLIALRKAIERENELLNAATGVLAANLPRSNAAPKAGGSARQVVETDVGSFQVDVVAADLNSTKVVVETASSGTCANDCPVASLADYVARAGGYAGINGPYFCPAEYPSCAGKTNSFDTLLMNRQKVYFNSDNNVYSNVPAAIFSAGSARFVGASQEWGRDTGPDSVIASQPMLLSGGEVRFGGDGDPKKGSRGNRSFIGSKGSTVYIGVVRSATVAETARVLKALGLDNALNLDSGGSTALYSGGKYLAGPGRQTPFGIVLARR